MKRRERRGHASVKPRNLKALLSLHQTWTLAAKERFGWTIAFVRKPLFQEVDIILTNPEKTEFLRLEEDGSTSAIANVRSDDCRAKTRAEGVASVGLAPASKDYC